MSAKEYYYLAKLAVSVLFNAIIVFSFKWFIDEALWRIKKKKFETG